VDTLLEIINLLGMAFPTFRGYDFGSSEFVHVAMARSAGRLPEGGVDAGSSIGRCVLVASGTWHLGNSGRMWELSDGCMAIPAPENSMRAGRVFARIDGDIPSLFRLHSRLTVAGEAGLIL